MSRGENSAELPASGNKWLVRITFIPQTTSSLIVSAWLNCQIFRLEILVIEWLLMQPLYGHKCFGGPAEGCMVKPVSISGYAAMLQSEIGLVDYSLCLQLPAPY